LNWEELLAEFRSLGGVFENTRIGEGASGRGVFVVDPAQPAIVFTPRNLLVPIDDVGVHESRLALKPQSGIGARERAFFEAYHRHFGWSAGLFDEIERQQSDWHQLPAELKRLICTMGAVANPENRFSAPTLDACLKSYIETRDLSFEGKPYIAPVLEMVNHSPDGRDYATHDGLMVAGTFESEVLARYNLRDAWAVALHYGFAHRSPYAYSLGITVEIYGGKRLSIDRDAAATQGTDGVRYPRREDYDDLITLANVMLGNLSAVDLPRAVFRKVMSAELTAAQADEVFDGVAFYNRRRFLDALDILEKYDGDVVRMLRAAAIHQLHALSACVGARTI
jgi:hypothetical protein